MLDCQDIDMTGRIYQTGSGTNTLKNTTCTGTLRTDIITNRSSGSLQVTGNSNVTGALTVNSLNCTNSAVIGNMLTADILNTPVCYADSITGELTGNVTGNTTGTHTGGVIGNVTGNTTGIHTGNVIGNITGNVTGNVTGDVIGDLTGTASRVNLTALSNQSNDYRIVMSLAASGSAALYTESAIVFNPAVNELRVNRVRCPEIGGIIIVNTNTLGEYYPIYDNVPDLSNIQSGMILMEPQTGSTIVGSLSTVNYSNIITRVVIYPDWGCVAYANTNYSGTVRINIKNTLSKPMCIEPAVNDAIRSIRVYLNDVEQN